jgi:phosphate transport system permease protein
MTIVTPIKNFDGVKPQMPWAPSLRDRQTTAGLVIAAAVASYVVVGLTPMKGKLAYFAIFFLALLALDYTYSRLKLGKAAGVDSFFKTLFTIAICVTILPIVSILWSVWLRGHKGLHWSLFTSNMKQADFTGPIGQGGLIHALVGTLIIISIAVVISVPIGILTAIYLTEIRGRFSRPIAFLVQAMSGVPSIVAGLFILAAIVYPLTRHFNGFEGSIALAILMIPTVARTAEEVLRLIPEDLREAGLALGGTQWRSVAQIVLPAARSGLFTAIILGVARIIGETAPIVLLTGGANVMNINPFSGTMESLPLYIWSGLLAGTPESFTRAWAGILILLALVVVLFAGARYLGSKKVAK